MEIDLIHAVRGELLKQGLCHFPANVDIPLFLDVDGESVKPAILHAPTQYGLNPEFHAIWCMSNDDGHIEPCEGNWDIKGITGPWDMRGMRDISSMHDMCDIRSLTVADGSDGDVYIEITWNDWKYTEYGKNPEADIAARTALTYAIARVLATIRHNREQHRMYGNLA